MQSPTVQLRASGLSVFVLRLPREQRMVAFSTKKGAAKLLGVSPYLLSVHGSTSTLPLDLEPALSEPGSVWTRLGDGFAWNKLRPAPTDLNFKPRGGRRDGAGRSPVGTEAARERSFRLDDARYHKYLALGGVRYLRQVIDAGLDLTADEWSRLAARGGGSWLREALESESGR